MNQIIEAIEYTETESGPGRILIACQGNQATNVILGKDDDDLVELLHKQQPDVDIVRKDADTNNYITKLLNYMHGSIKDLSDIPIQFPSGATEWQIKIWTKMRDIPYGKTITYGELAEQAGEKKESARAVGSVCAANELAILVPCHRVLSANPEATHNYRWGADWKKYLLDLEQNNK